MAKAATNAARAIASIDFASLNLNIADSEKRPITSPDVPRPTRDIIAELNKQVRTAAWQACLTTVADMHGNPVEAKGASWEVNDDEAARAIRVNYNLIQPDYYGNANRKASKMTLEASQDAWRQICAMLEKPEPTFTGDDAVEADDKEE